MKFETKEQALAAIEALNGKHKMEVCDCANLFVCVYMSVTLKKWFKKSWNVNSLLFCMQALMYI